MFNWLGWPSWIEGLLAFLMLDFAIYLQHVMSHALPLFWRLHQVHHADLDVDLTTGIRFHPVEIIISSIYKAAVVAALGIDPWIVILFEAVLNASAVYTHGNVRLPHRLDASLRWAFCTPDMHRIHHSTIPQETNSNFGFFLSVWDRACGTMRQSPAKGQLGVELGLSGYRDPARLGLLAVLLLPFRSIERAYTFTPRQERNASACRFFGRAQSDASSTDCRPSAARRRRWVASSMPLLYESGMHSRPQFTTSRSAALAAETLRALASTLLLLGLIGDRRAR